MSMTGLLAFYALITTAEYAKIYAIIPAEYCHFDSGESAHLRAFLSSPKGDQ